MEKMDKTIEYFEVCLTAIAKHIADYRDEKYSSDDDFLIDIAANADAIKHSALED